MLKCKDIEILKRGIVAHSYIAYQKYRQRAKYDHMFSNVIYNQSYPAQTIFFDFAHMLIIRIIDLSLCLMINKRSKPFYGSWLKQCNFYGFFYGRNDFFSVEIVAVNS